MIPNTVISAAINKLGSPIKDAPYLNQALSLAQSGQMFQNPFAGAMDHVSSLNLTSLASSFSMPTDLPAGLDALPDTSALVDAAKTAQQQMADVTKVTGQMFTQVMPTKASLPDSLAGLVPDQKTLDFGIPSVTQMISTVYSEQTLNANLGISPTDPCLPVTKSIEGAMSTARDCTSSLGGIAKDAKDLFNSGMSTVNESVAGVKAAAAEMAGKVGAELEAAKAAANAAIGGLKSAIGDVVDEVGNIKKGVMSQIQDVVKSAKDELDKISKSVTDSITEQCKSVEKSLHVNTAAMMKNVIGTNPCLKEVIHPGNGVLEVQGTFLVVIKVPTTSISPETWNTYVQDWVSSRVIETDFVSLENDSFTYDANDGKLLDDSDNPGYKKVSKVYKFFYTITDETQAKSVSTKVEYRYWPTQASKDKNDPPLYRQLLISYQAGDAEVELVDAIPSDVLAYDVRKKEGVATPAMAQTLDAHKDPEEDGQLIPPPGKLPDPPKDPGKDDLPTTPPSPPVTWPKNVRISKSSTMSNASAYSSVSMSTLNSGTDFRSSYTDGSGAFDWTYNIPKEKINGYIASMKGSEWMMIDAIIVKCTKTNGQVVEVSAKILMQFIKANGELNWRSEITETGSNWAIVTENY